MRSFSCCSLASPRAPRHPPCPSPSLKLPLRSSAVSPPPHRAAHTARRRTHPRASPPGARTWTHAPVLRPVHVKGVPSTHVRSTPVLPVTSARIIPQAGCFQLRSFRPYDNHCSPFQPFCSVPSIFSSFDFSIVQILHFWQTESAGGGLTHS